MPENTPEQNLATAINTLTSTLTGKLEELRKTIEGLTAAIKADMASRQGGPR
jgi:hypothetical protein